MICADDLVGFQAERGRTCTSPPVRPRVIVALSLENQRAP